MDGSNRSISPLTVWLLAVVTILANVAILGGGVWFLYTKGVFSSGSDMSVELGVANSRIEMLREQLKKVSKEKELLENKVLGLTRKINEYESGLEARRLELEAEQKRQKHEIEKYRLKNEYERILAEKLKAQRGQQRSVKGLAETGSERHAIKAE